MKDWKLAKRLVHRISLQLEEIFYYRLVRHVRWSRNA